MKLYFEPNLDYQLQAVEAVCALFRGQEACQTEFTKFVIVDEPQSVDGGLSGAGKTADRVLAALSRPGDHGSGVAGGTRAPEAIWPFPLGLPS